MQLIQTGFDGLDISYKLTICEELAEKLEAQRAIAEAPDSYLGLLQHNGVRMIVHASGAKGGYAFRCDTGLGGPFGENWFFKKPNGRADDWGVRVSCNALPLALNGLSKVRASIEATLSALGMKYEAGRESIGRVDVACDILAPDFVADRDHFVAHAQSTISEIMTDLMQIVGRSGRVETITIGKNPQRQVVLYDKRAEVIAKGKSYWWPIWDAALAAQGLPPLDPTDRAQSSVWRIEIRAYKRHLKDKWGVTTWGDLREKLPEILHYSLCDVRYTLPTGDSNRARWPDHPIWSIAHDAFAQDMEDLASMVDRAHIDALLLGRSDDALLRQITSCLISRAALFGIQEDRLLNFAEGTIHQLIRGWSDDKSRIREKLAQARSRYGAVGE
ncbi:hypothetical protein [Roseinatronobacter sp. S2]|uniref:hypothetical protein n=1 Tax=Roseinatronobacter sp. S2 TaxID=3035471 RepID=UPI002410B4A8|nr:hypothetical protein [Roseinatronobacter sp. S2]WFE75750.1 hypothetical protein P8S53_04895 [Roseinatronobacter sp. S2]